MAIPTTSTANFAATIKVEPTLPANPNQAATMGVGRSGPYGLPTPPVTPPRAYQNVGFRITKSARTPASRPAIKVENGTARPWHLQQLDAQMADMARQVAFQQGVSAREHGPEFGVAEGRTAEWVRSLKMMPPENVDMLENTPWPR